jgi:hypothetical protein
VPSETERPRNQGVLEIRGVPVQLGADRQVIVSVHRAAARHGPAQDGNARFITVSKSHGT